MARAAERPWLPPLPVDLPTVLVGALFLGVCALWPALPTPVASAADGAGMIMLVDAAAAELPAYRRPDLFALPSPLSFGRPLLGADGAAAALDLARPSLALDTIVAPARQSAFDVRVGDGLGAAEVMAEYAPVWTSPAIVARAARARGGFDVTGLPPVVAQSVAARCAGLAELTRAVEPWRVAMSVRVTAGAVQQVFIEDGSTDPVRDRLLARQLMGMPLAASPRSGGMVVIDFSGAVTATPSDAVESTEE